MKKEEKKSKKLWLAVAAVIVVIGVAAAAVLLSFGGSQPEATAPATTQTTEPSQATEPVSADPAMDGKLYWNVERLLYTGTELVRPATEEGLYRIRFAVDGEQLDLFAADRKVMEKIDTMEVMGLVLNSAGYVVDALHVDEFTGGFAVKNYFVTAVDGNTVTANASGSGAGLTKTLVLDENTKIYNMEGSGITVGIPDEVRFDDMITAVEDTEGRILVVYVEHPKPVGDVFWNVERLWNSATKTSTRKPDATGLYTYEFILKGEKVTLYTRNAEIADKADVTARFINVEYDDQGFITGVNTFRSATGGSLFAGGYYVSEIDAQGKVTAVSSDGETSGTAYMADECWVMDVTAFAKPYGKLTELQVGDQIYGIKNSRGKLCYVFVAGGRTVDGKVYWNVDRNWNKTTLTTNRRPAADGYYYFKMAVDGSHVTVRTNDLTTAEFMEKNVCCALTLDGDTVTGAYTAPAVTGGSVFASWYEVTAIDGEGNITAYRKDQDKTVKGKLAENCDIFNVSDSATREGERTSSVRVGDTVHCFKNQSGEVVLAYVVTRPFNGPIYWNVERKYDSANKVSTREPADDGYYYFTMAVKGEHITVKTKNKEFVNSMDAKTCMSLQLSGDTVTKVLTAASTQRTKGGLFGTNYTVTAINGNYVTASNGTKTVSAYYMADCEFYNVSKFATLIGEKTKLRVGDKINGLLNSDKKLTVVYILSTLNHEAHTCDCCGQNVQWMSWDGVSELTDGHYCIGGDTNVWIRAKAGATVTICLNGKNLNGNARVFNPINEGVTINIVDCGDAHVHGKSGYNASIGIVNGGTLNIYGGTYTAEACTEAGKSGGLLSVTNGGTLNIYGGTFSGGNVTAAGGNFNVNNGVMNIYDGIIEKGTAGTYGGNIAVSGSETALNIYGGTIRGGVAGTHGGNLGNGYGPVNVYGGIIENGTAVDYGNAVSITNSGSATFAGGIVGGDVYYKASGTLTLSGDVQLERLDILDKPATAKDLGAAKVGLNAPASVTLVTGLTDAAQKDLFTCLAEGTMEYVEGSLVLTLSHKHCFCENAQALPAGHACADVVWTAIDGSTTISENGYYYYGWLGGKAAAITVADGVEAYLCLNGAQSYAGIPVALGTGSKLTICDCSDGKTGEITVSLISTRAPICIDKAAEVTLMSGTVRGVANKSQQQCVQVVHTNGVFNMYGGKLTDGHAVVATDGTAGNGGNLQLSIGTANIYGGTLENGTADRKGQSIYVGSQGKLTLGGTLNIADIYLSAGKTITVDPSLTGSTIGVTLATSGTVATGVSEAQAAYFTIVKGIKTWTDNTLSATLVHSHCFCENTETLPAGHTCAADQVWTPVVPASYAIKLESDGFYYFDWTSSKAATLTVKAGVKAHVCLNGASLVGTQPIKLETGAELILCDCAGTGSVFGSATSAGALLKLTNGCKLTLMSGSILGGSTNKSLPAISMTHADAVVTVYGGIIAGGETTGNGGAINLEKGTLVLLGGKVTDGAAALGKAVYVAAGGNITIGGKAKCGEIYLTDGKTLGVDASVDTSECRVTVTLEDPADPIATGLSADISACVATGNIGRQVKFDTGKLVLEAAPHVHCLCKGAEAKPQGHVCTENQAWTALTADTTLTDGGHYYLTDTFKGNIKAPVGATVYLCLNGQRMETTDRIAASYTSGQLHICDCSGAYDETAEAWTYAGTLHSKYVAGNAAIATLQGGDLYIYGGNFSADAMTASNKNGGLFTVMSGSAMYIYGGNIHGGRATGYGGNINLSNATIKMYGGRIGDGTSGSGKYGGNIAISNTSGVFEMYGGVIENGTAGSHGGNIGIGFGTFRMYGGTLKGGSAGTKGGSVSVFNTGAAYFLGGSVTMGTATEGGCVYTDKSSVTVGGTAVMADVYLNTGAKLLIQGTPTGSVNVTVEDPTAVIADTEVDLSAVIRSTDPAYVTSFDETAKALKLIAAPTEP